MRRWLTPTKAMTEGPPPPSEVHETRGDRVDMRAILRRRVLRSHISKVRTFRGATGRPPCGEAQALTDLPLKFPVALPILHS